MRSARGFSLAEVLVAVAVLGIVMTALYFTHQQGLTAYLVGSGRVEAQQNARAALDLMLGELRGAQSITSAPGCDSGGTDITLVDQTGTNTIRYRLTGSNLERFVNPSASPTATADNVVIGSVAALAITCYAGDGATPTAVAADVRSVTVALRSRTDESTSDDAPANPHMVVESHVRLRNLP